MATLPNGLQTFEIGSTAPELLNANFALIDPFLTDSPVLDIVTVRELYGIDENEDTIFAFQGVAADNSAGFSFGDFEDAGNGAKVVFTQATELLEVFADLDVAGDVTATGISVADGAGVIISNVTTGLRIERDGGGAAPTVTAYRAGTSKSGFVFEGARGSKASPDYNNSGDDVGFLDVRGRFATGGFVQQARLSARATQQHTDTNRGMAWRVAGTANNSATLTNAVDLGVVSGSTGGFVDILGAGGELRVNGTRVVRGQYIDGGFENTESEQIAACVACLLHHGLGAV